MWPLIPGEVSASARIPALRANRSLFCQLFSAAMDARCRQPGRARSAKSRREPWQLRSVEVEKRPTKSSLGATSMHAKRQVLQHSCSWHNRWLGVWFVGVKPCYCKQHEAIDDARTDVKKKRDELVRRVDACRPPKTLDDASKFDLEVARWAVDRAETKESQIVTMAHEQWLQDDARKVQVMLAIILIVTLAATIIDIWTSWPVDAQPISPTCSFSSCGHS